MSELAASTMSLAERRSIILDEDDTMSVQGETIISGLVWAIASYRERFGADKSVTIVLPLWAYDYVHIASVDFDGLVAGHGAQALWVDVPANERLAIQMLVYETDTFIPLPPSSPLE